MPSCRIAIIGVSCRLPGHVDGLDDLWSLLLDGRDAITEIPDGRWARTRYLHPDRKMPGHTVTMAAGVVHGHEDFDAAFFGISPKEAAGMDPQQRMALELAWEALEDAGLRPSRLAGSDTGVYVGVASSDASTRRIDDPAQIDSFAMLNTNMSIVSNRVSDFFDLRGPSMSIDTACSSSLVALHQAARAMERDGLPLALVGGVNVLLSPFPFVGFSQAHMLAADGRCRVFDADGQGYVRAEGGGFALLKPLDAALRDGDRVHAVLRSTDLNTNGRNTAIALPDADAQAALLRRTYQGDLAPARLAYMEAHGTGTAVGDPVEAKAIGLALPPRGRNALWVGSVKSNLGHMETASGMAGLLKAILVLRRRIIPPNLHFKTPNPAIDFEGLKISVPTKAVPLPATGGPALAGVNSFGFGGTNAHVVLEEAPPEASRDRPASAPAPAPAPASAAEAGRGAPLCLSARSPEALAAMAGEYAALLERRADLPPAAIAAAHLERRETHGCRMVATADSRVKLIERLKSYAADPENSIEGVLSGAAPSGGGKTVFLFTGNGTQWSGMGRTLLESEPAFAEVAGRIDGILNPLQGWSVREAMARPVGEAELARTEVAQPLIFTLQAGVAAALRARGLTPDFVLGHSIGEVAAAWAADILSLEQAARLIHHRSVLQGRLRGMGVMAAVGVSVERAKRLIDQFGGGIEIVAYNTPRNLTLAGDEAPLRELVAQVRGERGFAQMLKVDYPFHSTRTETLREPLLAALSGLAPGAGRVEFISSVTGDVQDGRGLDADYWWRNIANPVNFTDATRTAFDRGARLFLEIGPHKALDLYIKENARFLSIPAVTLPTLARGADEAARLECAWKSAWTRGWPVDWSRHFPDAAAAGPARDLELPTYPWHRERHWLASTPESAGIIIDPPEHSLLGWRRKESAPAWENRLDTAAFPWLADHVAGDCPLMPAAGFVELALAAAARRFGHDRVGLENLRLLRPLQLPPGVTRVVESRLWPEDNSFVVSARKYMSGEGWTRHAETRLLDENCAEAPPPREAAAKPDDWGRRGEVKRLYAAAARCGLSYGPAFRGVKEIWLRDGQALARLEAPADAGAADWEISPLLLDGAFQTLFALLPKQTAPGAFLPVWIGRAARHAAGVPAYSLATLTRVGERSVVAAFDLLDEAGRVLSRFTDCRFGRAESFAAPAPRGYTLRWEPQPHPSLPPGAGRPGTAEYRKALAAADFPADPRFHAARPLLRLALLAAARGAVADRLGDRRSAATSELEITGRLDAAQVPFFTFLAETLQEAGQAERDDERWRLAESSSLPSFEAALRMLMAEHASAASEALPLARTAAELSGILAGDKGALASWREAGSLRQAFAAIPWLHDLDRTLAVCLGRVLAKLPDHVRLRVVEARAGSGRLSEMLLPAFAAAAVDYLVTDPDEEAVDQLRTQLGETPRRRLAALSLDGPPARQGQADVLVTSHGLSAARDPQAALENAWNLLAPGGVLLAAERSPSTLADFLWGADPDWWSQSSDPETPVSRLADHATWKRRLAEAGFVDVHVAVPKVAAGREDADAPDGFVIFARRPDETAAAMPPPVPSTSTSAPPAPPARARLAEAEPLWLLVGGRAAGRAGAALLSGLVKKLRTTGADVATLLDDPVGGAAEPANLSARLPAGVDPVVRADAGDVAVWVRWFAGLPKGVRANVVFALGFDTVEEPEDFAEIQERRVVAAAMLAQGWEKAGRPPARLWLLCGGGSPAPLPGGRAVPPQGALWGLGRTLMNEMSDLDTRLVDLQCATPGENELTALLRELTVPGEAVPEREVAFVAGERYVPRLGLLTPDIPEPVSASAMASGRFKSVAVTPDAALAFDSPGRFEKLYWRKTRVPAPPPGQVRIEMRAVGLNFRDVMWASGLLPEEALENGFSGPTLGLEGAGVVDAVGEGVTRVGVGDHVMCFGASCFATRVVTPENSVTRLPADMDALPAATLPVTFFTAWYALKHLANLQPGESVLIHGAAGGVGLAAVQLAGRLGLRILATAGTEEKRSLLRSLGVEAVFDSRGLDFARQVMEATDGRGVDAVLNSLAGEAAARSLGCLAPFGRFLELGKRDFFANAPMRLRPFRRNASYFGVDVDQLFNGRPALMAALWDELAGMLERREISPLPYRAFDASEVAAAFSTMKEARHIGKIVVRVGADVKRLAHGRREPPQWPLAAGGTYLVTGGLGGFGLATAARLVDEGAGHLLLLGRSEPGEAAAARLDAWRARGVDVAALAADVSDPRALGMALDAALAGRPPLRGVVHAAAVVDDALVSGLTPERLSSVLGAKATGAWNLHRYVGARPLDFFLLYSSATTLFGNPGQANYVAANAALEALAVYRRGQGLAATAVGWGAIGDAGMLTRRPETLAAMRRTLGVVPLAAGQALDHLPELLAAPAPAPALCLMEWNRLRAMAIAKTPMLGNLAPGAGAGAGGPSLRELLDGKPPAEGVAITVKFVAEQIASVMRLPLKRLPLDAPFHELGLDSLMATELALALEDATGVSFPPGLLAEDRTVRGLSEWLYLEASAERKFNDLAAEDVQLLEHLAGRHGVRLGDGSAVSEERLKELAGGAAKA